MEPDDQELFNSAVSNEPVPATPAEPVAPQSEPAAQARDDQGRFAPSETNDGTGQPAAQPSGEAEHKEPPPHRFREVSERARAAEARSAELERLLSQLSQNKQPEAPKPEQPAPDVWEDPDAWADRHLKTSLDPISQQVGTLAETWSRRFAEREHGVEKVQAAYQALDAAINSGKLDGAKVKADLAKSMDPYGDILGWHGRQAAETALSSVGNDIEAYNQKIISDYLASQQQAGQSNAAPAQPNGGTIVKLPPNLNRMTSAASDNGAVQDVDGMELFNSTISQRRR